MQVHAPSADSTGVLTWVVAAYLLALFIDLLQLLLQLLQSCLCHVLQDFSIRCPLVLKMRSQAHWVGSGRGEKAGGKPARFES